MDKDDIIKNLKLLGEELEELEIQKPVHVLMIGGGYMLTQMGNRSLTEDIDAFTRLDKYGEDYQRFRAAVRFIKLRRKTPSFSSGDRRRVPCLG
jgi:hypothetical protein